MIAKIITGSDITGVLKYNTNKVEEGEAKILYAANCVSKSMDDDYSKMSLSDLYRSFKPNLDANKRTENPVAHIILSMKENDISDDKLSEIAQEYMNRMGYASQPYVVVKHSDVENIHLHVVSVKVYSDGKKLDDKYEKVRSNTIRKELETEYGLVEAEQKKESKAAKFNREVRLVNDYIDKISFHPKQIQYGESDLKKRIGTVIRFVKEFKNVADTTTYNHLLHHFNVHCEAVNGIDKEGNEYVGVQYYVIKEDGISVSRGISGSTFGKDFSWSGLQNRFNEASSNLHDKSFKYAKKLLRYNINRVLSEYSNGISEERFAAELQKRGIQVQFFKNEQGLLYGVSFIDNVNKQIVKGSDVQFSSNDLRKLFKSNDEVISNAEMKEMEKELRSIYNKHRREHYFYESDFIQSLPVSKPDFLRILQDKFPDKHCHEHVLDKFIASKIANLKSIEEKERAYFQASTQSILNYVQQLDFDQRSNFLFAMGYRVEKGRLYPAKSDHPSIELPCLVAGEPSLKYPLSKQERDVVKYVVKGELDKINFNMMKNLPFDNILSKADVLAIRSKMTQDVVDGILSQTDKNGMAIFEALLNGGFIIHPVEKEGRVEYFVGSYDEKEFCHGKLNREISLLLDGIDYKNRYPSVRSLVYGRSGKPNLKYSAIVQIVRAKESGDLQPLKSLSNYLEKVNPDLSKQFKTLLAKQDFDAMVALVQSQTKDSMRMAGYVKRI